MKYVYSIDLDERGSFRASVSNPKGKTVYEILAGDELGEDESSIFEDGYMRDKNDISGLETYLKELRVIPKTARIVRENPREKFTVKNISSKGKARYYIKQGGKPYEIIEAPVKHRRTVKRMVRWHTSNRGVRVNPSEKCNTCGRDVHSPYRVYDGRGKVLQGCVDESHTGHLVTPSESAFWHNRPGAKKIRAAMKKGREGKGYGIERNPRRPLSQAQMLKNPDGPAVRKGKNLIRTRIGKLVFVQYKAIARNGNTWGWNTLQSFPDTAAGINQAKTYAKRHSGLTQLRIVRK